jgi:hypothetical protein
MVRTWLQFNHDRLCYAKYFVSEERKSPGVRPGWPELWRGGLTTSEPPGPVVGAPGEHFEFARLRRWPSSPGQRLRSSCAESVENTMHVPSRPTIVTVVAPTRAIRSSPAQRHGTE